MRARKIPDLFQYDIPINSINTVLVAYFRDNISGARPGAGQIRGINWKTFAIYFICLSFCQPVCFILWHRYTSTFTFDLSSFLYFCQKGKGIGYSKILSHDIGLVMSVLRESRPNTSYIDRLDKTLFSLAHYVTTSILQIILLASWTSYLQKIGTNLAQYFVLDLSS